MAINHWFSPLLKRNFRLLLVLILVFVNLPVRVSRAAVFSVTVNSDTNDGVCDSNCSLREAIIAANENPGTDLISLSGINTLSIAGANEDLGYTGDLDITDSVDMVGTEGSQVMGGVNFNDRVFHIIGETTVVHMTQITISNGKVQSYQNGGGIYNQGSLFLDTVTVSENTAGVYPDGGTGGGIFNSGSLSIDNSTFSGNSSTCGGGGIESGTGLSINHSTFDNNATDDCIGGAGGSAIEAGGTANISNSIFSANKNHYAIQNWGTMSISQSVFEGNTQGAIIDQNGSLDISGSSIINNSSSWATPSALYHWGSGSLTVRNTTVSGNVSQSANSVGGIQITSSNEASVVNLNNVTIFNNTGDQGGLDIKSYYGTVYPTVNISNSIIAGNHNLSGQLSDCSGPLISQGYNLIGSTAGCTISGDTSGNITDQEARLAPLTGLSGQTYFHPLYQNSPAVDAGSELPSGSGSYACESTDQAGNSRPADGNGDGSARCDIGAYEGVTQAPADCTAATAPQPVLLVHGWGGPDQLSQDTMGFAQLSQWLYNNGYRENCNMFYATGVNSSKSWDEIGKVIQTDLHAYYDQLDSRLPGWNGNFDIIAHSYGGIWSRVYLESSLYKNDQHYRDHGIHINNLFTLGSPHGGAQFPGEVYPGTALIAFPHILSKNPYEFLSAMKMLSPSMDEYNFTHRQPEGVCYRLIGGDFFQQVGIPAAFRKVYQSILTPNDLGVSQRSSLQLWSNPALQFFYPKVVAAANSDMHGFFPKQQILGPFSLDLSGFDSYVRPDTTFKQSVLPKIGKSMSDCQRTTQATVAAAVSQATTPEPIHFASGSLTENGVSTGTMKVDWSGETTFYVTWMEGKLSFQLTDPNGNSVTPDIALADPAIDYIESDPANGFGLAAYTISQTVPGDWMFTITATSGPYPIPYDIYANPAKLLTLSLTTSEWQKQNMPVAIFATLNNGSYTIPGAALTGTITLPDGTTSNFNLLDDGTTPDATAGDGIYSATFSGASQEGYYRVFVQASGKDAGADFWRSAENIFTVTGSRAEFTGVDQALPVDENKDGYFEYLDVTARVTVHQPGKVLLSAVLQAQSGPMISQANVEVPETAGENRVVLRFPGNDIFASQTDGPFQVTQVKLIDEDQYIKLGQQEHVFITQAYKYQQFGTRLKFYLPGILR